MALITQVTLRNFRGFREEISISFAQSSYLIGVNNVGKTNILHAIRAFFDDACFVDETFLNRTEYAGKREKYNQSEIRLRFNLQELTTRARKAGLIKNYGDSIEIRKIVTFTPIAQAVSIKWLVGEDEVEYDPETLPKDIRWLLSSVKVTYIHPQEGQNLFDSVQRRLRDRLLQNWGRNPALTHQIQDLEKNWLSVRNEANKYLSKSLSDSLQGFWPGCKIFVDLPKKVSDVIAVSDIGFQGDSALPEIQLTAQGTGAQSTVLYLAQYLLDSDRSLNKGEYHPVWLMEEPESFLHADLLFKISSQINSDAWLDNIQMVISTHSPILLASSRISREKVVWNVLKGKDESMVIHPSDAKVEDILKIGAIMGDANFYAYFISSQKEKVIFIEDKKPATKKAFEDIGINISDSEGGISAIGKYLDVFSVMPEILKVPAYFIVDADKGADQIYRYISSATEVENVDGFRKLKVQNLPDVFIILLKDGWSIEDMFYEYENHVRDCVSKVWDDNLVVRENPAGSLSSVVTRARRTPVENVEDAYNLIKNEGDVKSLFWSEVLRKNYRIGDSNAATLKRLLGL